MDSIMGSIVSRFKLEFFSVIFFRVAIRNMGNNIYMDLQLNSQKSATILLESWVSILFPDKSNSTKWRNLREGMAKID